VPAIFYFKKHSTKYYWKHFSGYCNYQFFTSWVYGYVEAHQWVCRKGSRGFAGYLRHLTISKGNMSIPLRSRVNRKKPRKRWIWKERLV